MSNSGGVCGLSVSSIETSGDEILRALGLDDVLVDLPGILRRQQKLVRHALHLRARDRERMVDMPVWQPCQLSRMTVNEGLYIGRARGLPMLSATSIVKKSDGAMNRSTVSSGYGRHPHDKIASNPAP